MGEVDRERQQLSMEVSSLRSQLSAREEEVQRAREQMEETERQNKEVKCFLTWCTIVKKMVLEGPAVAPAIVLCACACTFYNPHDLLY